MTRDEILRALERCLESAPHSLHGPEILATLPEWDSLSAVNVKIFADRTLHASVSATQIADCRTVDELATLLENAGK